MINDAQRIPTGVELMEMVDEIDFDYSDDEEHRYETIEEVHAEEYDEEEDEYGHQVLPDTTDEKTGEVLDPELVEKARNEELSFMKSIRLYDEVPLSECYEKTGKGPVDTKWVDRNKGTAECPDIRCRLVARDFRPRGDKDRADLFAAMPPLEAKKLLFRMAAAGQHEW